MKIYSLKQCSWGNRCLILICVTIMNRCLSLMYLLLHRFPWLQDAWKTKRIRRSVSGKTKTKQHTQQSFPLHNQDYNRVQKVQTHTHIHNSLIPFQVAQNLKLKVVNDFLTNQDLRYSCISILGWLLNSYAEEYWYMLP